LFFGGRAAVAKRRGTSDCKAPTEGFDSHPGKGKTNVESLVTEGAHFNGGKVGGHSLISVASFSAEGRRREGIEAPA